MSRTGYYPGCSLKGTAREYEESLLAVAEKAGRPLAEIADWNCCGATAAHGTSHELAIALPARVLAQAITGGMEELLVPCSGCYNRLMVTRHELSRDPALRDKISKMIGADLKTPVRILNVLEWLETILAPGTEDPDHVADQDPGQDPPRGDIPVRDDVPTQGDALKPDHDSGHSDAGDHDPDPVRELITHPFNHKVACYYGCFLTRPVDVLKPDSAEYPMAMDQLMERAGATPVDWEFKVECCGAAFAVSRTTTIARLSGLILENAVRRGAEAIIVACPLCHANMDLRRDAIQKERNREIDLPVLYLPQAIGLAMGIEPRQLGLHRHRVPVTFSLNPRNGAPDQKPEPRTAKQPA